MLSGMPNERDMRIIEINRIIKFSFGIGPGHGRCVGEIVVIATAHAF